MQNIKVKYEYYDVWKIKKKKNRCTFVFHFSNRVRKGVKKKERKKRRDMN